VFDISPADSAPHAVPDTRTIRCIVLLGPGFRFWEVFTASHEYTDERPHPLDRWSQRVISNLADSLGASALFPFGGPPFRPFPDWALNSGRFWSSPGRLLVHDQTGLMVSFRGALGFSEVVSETDAKNPHDLPEKPCTTCKGQPCLTACPVDALTETGYDIARCKSFLQSDAGRDCMERGCAVRRACPISKGALRYPEQSAFHMRAFL